MSGSRPRSPTRSRAERFRWTKRLLAVTIAMLVPLLLCEVGLRLFWHNSYRGDSTDHMLRLHLHPAHRDYVVDRSFLDPDTPTLRFRTDARSYILPSRQHADPDVTIAFLGGSTTECQVVKEELRFPALVSTLMSEGDLRVNTLNAAAAGNTTHDSVNVLFNHVIEDDPDIVVMMHATNDFGTLAAHGDYRSRLGAPLSAAAQWKWFKQKLTRHVYILAFVRKALARRGIRYPQADQIRWRNSRNENLPVEAYRRRLRSFAQLCRVFDIQPVLVTQPLASITAELTPDWANLSAQDLLNEIVRDVGRRDDVPVIDLARHLVESVPDWDRPGRIFFDGMHVTDEGSRVYAAHIADRLQPLVEQVMARRAAAEASGASSSVPPR